MKRGGGPLGVGVTLSVMLIMLTIDQKTGAHITYPSNKVTPLRFSRRGVGPLQTYQVRTRAMCSSSIPNLSHLSQTLPVDDIGVQGVGVPGFFKKPTLGEKNLKWHNWILRDTWSGVPGGMGYGVPVETKKALGGSEKRVREAALSPHGEWERRVIQPVAKLVGSGCVVQDNEFGFEPQGRHQVPASMVEEGLRAHYAEETVEDIKRDIGIPPPNATSSHLRRWVRLLPPPPWWNAQTKPSPPKDVSARLTRQSQSTKVNVRDAQGNTHTWFGPVDSDKKPNGIGIFINNSMGDSFRGEYVHGVRKPESMGTKFLANGVAETGWYDLHDNWVPAQMVANQELVKEQNRASTIGSGFSYTDRMLIGKPGMGHISAGDGQIVLRRTSSDVNAAITRFFNGSNPSQLGLGADAQNYMLSGTGYTKLIPIATFDVDYNRSQLQRNWERVQTDYVANYGTCPTNDLKVRTQMAFVDEDGSSITSQGVPLDERTGEKYLVHGSSALAIESILNTSYDIGRSRAGWYGRAVYFADDPSKSDQYARHDAFKRTPGLLARLGINNDEWNSIAVTSSQGHKNVFFMFITRVALGCTAQLTKDRFDKNMTPEQAGVTQPLFSDANYPPTGSQMRTVTKLNSRFNSVAVDAYSEGNTNMRFREVTVYNSVVAKITHLVAYVRANPMSVSDKAKLGENWKDPFSVNV